MSVKKFAVLCATLASVGIVAQDVFAGGQSQSGTAYRAPLSDGYAGIRSWFDRNTGGGFLRYDGNTTAWYGGHYGVDFNQSSGGIWAGANGVVVDRKNDCPEDGSDPSCGGRFGNNVKLRHADGKFTVYGHMKKGSVVVAMNQTVLCSALLGNIGQSGENDGPHLHFETRVSATGYSRDVAYDPFGGPAGMAYGWRSSPYTSWVDQNFGYPVTRCQ